MKALLLGLGLLFATLGAGADKPAKPTRLEFFAVSQDKIPGGRFIDTREFPKLGFIPAKPGLVVGELANAALVGRGEKFPVLQITLLKKDAKALAAFTKRHVGGRILLMLDDLPLIAPTVREPIRTRALQIPIKDRAKLRKLLPALRRLAGPKR